LNKDGDKIMKLITDTKIIKLADKLAEKFTADELIEMLSINGEIKEAINLAISIKAD